MLRLILGAGLGLEKMRGLEGGLFIVFGKRGKSRLELFVGGVYSGAIVVS